MSDQENYQPDANFAAPSRDSFFHGGFQVLQPVASGHRSGSDALLLAAALPLAAKGALADLGSGSGVAALAALVANPGLTGALVELDPFMASLARQTLQLPQNRSIAPRAQVIEADVTLAGGQRVEAGLMDRSFDHVIMNPPYNRDGYREPQEKRRALAHMERAGGLEAWVRTSAAILRPGGTVCLIHRAEFLCDILDVTGGRFGGLCVLPLHAREGEPASRVIIRATKGSRAPLSLYPGVYLHKFDNCPTEIAEAALNGRARLFPDQ